MSQTYHRSHKHAALLTPNPRQPPYTGGCRTRAHPPGTAGPPMRAAYDAIPSLLLAGGLRAPVVGLHAAPGLAPVDASRHRSGQPSPLGYCPTDVHGRSAPRCPAGLMAAVRIAAGAAVATCPRLVIRMGTLASMPPHPLWGLYVGNARDHVPHGKGVPVELIVRVLTCLDEGEAGVPLPECSRWTRTLCFSGWWKQRRSFRPLYVTASAMCTSDRCNWTSCMPSFTHTLALARRCRRRAVRPVPRVCDGGGAPA
jgi:hypothetical protein